MSIIFIHNQKFEMVACMWYTPKHQIATNEQPNFAYCEFLEIVQFRLLFITVVYCVTYIQLIAQFEFNKSIRNLNYPIKIHIYHRK
jgi:hypothetical protein